MKQDVKPNKILTKKILQNIKYTLYTLTTWSHPQEFKGGLIFTNQCTMYINGIKYKYRMVISMDTERERNKTFNTTGKKGTSTTDKTIDKNLQLKLYLMVKRMIPPYYKQSKDVLFHHFYSRSANAIKQEKRNLKHIG